MWVFDRMTNVGRCCRSGACSSFLTAAIKMTLIILLLCQLIVIIVGDYTIKSFVLLLLLISSTKLSTLVILPTSTTTTLIVPITHRGWKVWAKTRQESGRKNILQTMWLIFHILDQSAFAVQTKSPHRWNCIPHSPSDDVIDVYKMLLLCHLVQMVVEIATVRLFNCWRATWYRQKAAAVSRTACPFVQHS